MEMLCHLERFEVSVTNKLFGSLGAQLQGELGMAPSANMGAEGIAMFEPVHGSAPKYAGRDIANPLTAIQSAKMLLAYLGHTTVAVAVGKAVRHAVQVRHLPVDVGGSRDTTAVGDFVAAHV